MGNTALRSLLLLVTLASCASSPEMAPPIRSTDAPILISVEGPCPPPVIIDSVRSTLGSIPRSLQNGVHGALTVRVISIDSNGSPYGARVRLAPDTTTSGVLFAALVPGSGLVSWRQVPGGTYWLAVDGVGRRTTYGRVAVRISGDDTITVPTQYLPICDAVSQ